MAANQHRWRERCQTGVPDAGYGRLGRVNLTKTAVLIALTIVATGCGSAPASPSASNAPGTTTCVYNVAGTASRPAKLPPTTGVSNSGTVDYVLTLNGQPVGLKLLRDSAPCAVNSFTSLAAQGFYDNTSCHRLGTPAGFQMLQCGDPEATGGGGPGYQFAEELSGTETYPAGTLAMARTSRPGTSGSQFFLVFGDTQLDPDYTVFGKIDSDGLKALTKLAANGTDDSEAMGVGKPKTPAVISSVKPR
ncbi:MAG: peptidylprolyl isomerase [Actinobacteria bacterium]|nr:peptidylprolyl isomerase [Propionicimonas sp.]MBU3977453.1 peptidylprolyl isomerase [Actinomycetota bacterium]MBU3985963.1 peptidylprolyl isomerase [Actinomycetota bacterium]MBU4008748.1 peptidylprolyl isomerase [Actinomycetota bacterium]MBU4066102.1 peptidylprolyl isomerase [Actinomycetota bacterium]